MTNFSILLNKKKKRKEPNYERKYIKKARFWGPNQSDTS